MSKESEINGLTVLGMHRSGTSCLAGMLELAGFNLGMVDKWNPDNLRGNRENQAILKLNGLILNESGGTWYHPPTEIITNSANSNSRDQILKELAEQGRPWMFKDPRVLINLQFWLNADSRFKMIGVIRNPFAVAKSLHVRDKIPIVEGLRLWNVYNSHLLEAAQTHEVPILYFINDKEDFENAVKKALISVFPDEIEQGVLTLEKMGDFLSTDLVHQEMKITHEFFNHLIESGLENDESKEIDLLWQSLLDLTLNPPKIDPNASIPVEKQHFPQEQPMQTMGDITPSASVGFETSLNNLNKQIANSTGQTALWRQGVELFLKSDKKPDLAIWIELHLKKCPDEPYLLFELAKLYWDAGDRFHAIEIIENCVLLAPGWIPALKYLADWYTKSKQWEKATKALSELSKYEGTNQSPHKTRYAQLYFDLGDGFNEPHSIRNEFILTDRTITNAFDLSRLENVLRLRLDPINEFAVVHVEHIHCIGENGTEYSVQPTLSNARHEANSTYYFDNDDSQLIFEDLSNLREKPVRFKVQFKILQSGLSALQACISVLAEATKATANKENGHELKKNNRGVKVDLSDANPPPFICNLYIQNIEHEIEQSGGSLLKGCLNISENHLIKLALKYAGTTRIYALNYNTLESDKELSEVDYQMDFCRPVPRNCIIELGIEHDMRIFWLTSVAT